MKLKPRIFAKKIKENIKKGVVCLTDNNVILDF